MVKFFFADSFDMVDPTFDFETESRSELRVRQRDDQYPHEIFPTPPYDGVLVSKSMVDGHGAVGSRYSLAQRQRFWRNGVRSFMRLDQGAEKSSPAHPPQTLQTMGDCGAFSYVKEKVPPVTTTEVINFYERCGFDYGISVDHVILGYESKAGAVLPGFVDVFTEWRERQKITLDLASDFLKEARSSGARFVPYGVAQGWNPASYAESVKELQKIGYLKIALGGMVPLRTSSILECLEAIQGVKNPSTEFHMLGVTRCDHIHLFQAYGVTSFDSTSPLRQAFKDAKDNYYTRERNFTAIRIPQVEGNARLQARIRSGELSQDRTRELERKCLWGLKEFDKGALSVEDTLDCLVEYEQVHHPGESKASIYRETLTQRPWSKCECQICRAIGIQVIVFRGTERNKRRGFHNLNVFFENLQTVLHALPNSRYKSQEATVSE